MTLREAMSLAFRDFYANSWRLVPINAALGAVLVAGFVATLAVPAATVVVLAAGPITAALVHCAVTLVQTGNLALGDGWDGLRLHWRRGLSLGAAGAGLTLLAVLAVRTYASASLWPLAMLTVYVFVLLGIYQLVLWTLAIAQAERPLRSVAREALLVVGRRPGGMVVLGLVLLLVNAVGFAAAVMPFLTLTLAYTFLTAAHFLLEPTAEEAV
jgi:hypothetical protein